MGHIAMQTSMCAKAYAVRVIVNRALTNHAV
jgi:hypothetical protein